MAIPEKIDHIESGLSKLLDQFKDSPKAQALLAAYLAEANEVEEALLQLLHERGIFEAEGEQLDILGALFGIRRNGKTDTKLRAEILTVAAGLTSDGTTEVFMQVLRTTSGSDYVDFFEHPSGDVHALLGAGSTVDTYSFLSNLVPAGVNLRIYVDDKFDSFAGTELTRQVSDLVTDQNADVTVTPDGVNTYDLVAQRNEISDLDDDAVSILPEINDPQVGPFFAELLFSAVKTTAGSVTDENGNFIVDNNLNNIIWIDYEF